VFSFTLRDGYFVDGNKSSGIMRGSQISDTIMKYDFRYGLRGDMADSFCSWLEQVTIESLSRSYGDGEATKAAIFLFVNRAYEARMPESKIGEMFGKCIVRAGFQERDEEAVFAWLEHFGQIAAKVYACP
jgi:hypothetical protein